MKKSCAALAFTGLALAGMAGQPAQSATLNLFSDLTSFTTAVGGGPLLLQDFEGFATGTDLAGAAFLPGVSVTTNMDLLRVFGVANHTLFGTGDERNPVGSAFYDIALGLPYTSIAFDITAFEADPANPSTAQGPGTLRVNFADATFEDLDVFGNLAGDPIFIGLVSDTVITSIRWTEALEASSGNEETSLDNFRVAQIPEPATLALLGLGLAGLAWTKRRLGR